MCLTLASHALCWCQEINYYVSEIFKANALLKYASVTIILTQQCIYVGDRLKTRPRPVLKPSDCFKTSRMALERAGRL